MLSLYRALADVSILLMKCAPPPYYAIEQLDNDLEVLVGVMVSSAGHTIMFLLTLAKHRKQSQFEQREKRRNIWIPNAKT